MVGSWSTLVPFALIGAAGIALVRTAWLRERSPGLALVQRVGLVLLTAPILLLLLVGATSLPTLLDGGATLPLSPDRLIDKTLLHLGLYLAVPLAGLLMVLGPRDFVGCSRAMLLRGEDRRRALGSTFAWAGGLSALLVGGVALGWGLVRAHGGGLLSAGGAEVVFSQVTPGVALLLAGVAAVAEEGMFRGVLLSHFERSINRPVAIALQAGLFGLIHAGYGSFVHVAAATVFGVLMGVLVTRAGLLGAILTHFLVNVAILGLWAGHPGLLTLTGLTLVALLVAAWALTTGSKPAPAAPQGSGTA